MGNTMETKLYKVLKDGVSYNGGNMAWSLPVKRGRGWKPGAWHEVEGEIIACKNGLHLTTKPYNWYQWGATIYEAQGEGDHAAEGDKIAFRRARLLRPVPEPEFITKARAFIATIPTVKWLQPDGDPRPEWKLYPNRDAAWDAARAAARDAVAVGFAVAWDAAVAAAWDAARAAAVAAAWDAARAAARAAAWDAARAAAWDAASDAARAAAWDAASDAALYTRVGCVCSDLPLREQDREHVRARWQVWEKGYGLACDIGGVLYVYEQLNR